MGFVLVILFGVCAYVFMCTSWPFGDNDLLIGSVCWDCKKPIHKYDDDAEVCIGCGGRNRRI